MMEKDMDTLSTHPQSLLLVTTMLTDLATTKADVLIMDIISIQVN
jgi:hypothetical protein